MHLFYRLDGHTATPCALWEWAEQFEDNAKRLVARTYLRDGAVRIQTDFLGIDVQADATTSPLLFETMCFAPGYATDGACTRAGTWEEAEEEHRAMVELVGQHAGE